jgi:hypothetical protein
MGNVTADSYLLKDSNGQWLGQVVLTSDGMFSSVTDWGNFSFAWRNFGDGSFKNFMMGLGTDYFASKIYTGMTYIICNKKVEQACKRYADKILPALQDVLKKEAEELKIKSDNDKLLPWA